MINKIEMDKLKDANIDAYVYDDTLIIAMHNELEVYKNDEYTNLLVDALHDIITSYCYMDLRDVNNTVYQIIGEMIIILADDDIKKCSTPFYSSEFINNKFSVSEKLFGYINYPELYDGKEYIKLNIENQMDKDRLKELIRTSFNVMMELSEETIKDYIDTLMKMCSLRANTFSSVNKEIKWKCRVFDLYSTINDNKAKYQYLSKLIEKEQLYKKLNNYYTDTEKVDALCKHLDETGNSFETLVYRCLLEIFDYASNNPKRAKKIEKGMRNEISHLVNHTMV